MSRWNRTVHRLARPWACACAVAVALLTASWIWPGGGNDAAATPHTISATNHPFDPDWPDVYLILSQKCAGCHRPGSDQCDLTTWEAVVDGETEDGDRLVVPGKLAASTLWRKVVWEHDKAKDAVEPEMPPDEAEWLTGGQLESIKRWILRGALKYKLPQTCSTRPLMEIDYPRAKECRACHPKQYEEWSRSMHAYAQHSPIFEAFNLTLIERTGGTMGTFCTRCHAPIGTMLGENGSRRNIHRSRLSMEGVTCVACHRLKRPYYKANVRRALVPGRVQDACMYGPFDDAVSAEHGSHPSVGSRHLKSAAFCGACHDVTAPTGVRLEEAYSEWQNSPAAAEGITCQQCHMGPIPGVPVPDDRRPLGRAAEVPGVDEEKIPLRRLTDHTFAGPDYSLLPDTEFPEKLDWMYEVDYRRPELLTDHQRKTLTDLRKKNRRQLKIARSKRHELLRNAAEICVKAPSTASAGEKIKLHVDVINKVSGHNFPTGFTAERQAWVEVTVLDAAGRPVFLSGDVDKNGDLRDEHSHEVEAGHIPWDRHLLNFQSRFVALTNRGTERPVVLTVNRHVAPLNVFRPATEIAASFGRPSGFRVSKGSIPPLATVGGDYPVRLPDEPGPCAVRVRLNYRHLPPVLLDKIGTPHLKHLLETVVIDEFQSTIVVE